jgi:hypothetical protein
VSECDDLDERDLPLSSVLHNTKAVFLPKSLLCSTGYARFAILILTPDPWVLRAGLLCVRSC